MKKIPSRFLLALLILCFLVGVLCISLLYQTPVSIHPEQVQ